MSDIKKISEDLKTQAKNAISKRSWTLKRSIYAAVIVLAAFIFYSQIRGYMERSHKVVMPPRPVSMATATQNDVRVFIEAFGSMATLNNTDVKSQVTGEIKEVLFKDGDNVKQGDVLFVIDASLYKAELDKATAAVSQDNIDLKMKKDTLARNDQLAAKNLVSQQDFEKYQTDVAYAEARLLLDRAAADQARINLDYCSVKAPISGLAGKRQVDVGNIVPANTGPTLVNIKTIDQLYVDFTVPERNFQDIKNAYSKEKLKVLVSPDAPGASPKEGQLVFLDNTIDNSTGTFALRAIISNDDHAFWPGQFVRVKLVLATLTGAVLVPSEAVQMGQKGPYLFAVKDGTTADLRFVEIGPKDGDLIVIKTGVDPGDTVVTQGQLMLRPGGAVMDASKIKAQKPDAGKKEENKKAAQTSQKP